MTRPSDVQIIARAFLERYGLGWLDQIDKLAPEIGLRVKEVPARAFEGALLRVKDAFAGTILLSSSIRDQGRKTFTLAHELGHYLLPRHGQEDGYCRGKKLDSRRAGLSRVEREANAFAAEILMPVERIGDLLHKEPSYETAAAISERCASSLSASAYRLAELTGHRFAVVWSENGAVKWSKGSPELDAEFRIRRDACSRQTLAARCFRQMDVPKAYDLVEAASWFFDRNLRPGAELLERSLYLPTYDAVITFLLVHQIIEQRSRFGDEW